MSVKYTLISSFTPLKNGDSFENDWPLHVTLLTWFELPEDKLGSLFSELVKLGLNTHAATIKGGKSELFGPETNIPVRLIKDQSALDSVQLKLLNVIDEFGAVVLNETFVGDGYRAHVSDTAAQHLSENETARVTSMSLIREDSEGVRVVINTYEFAA